MSLLNALLAVATVLPVLSAHPVAVFASGLLFGGVFLSVVASTTALVRHNLAAGDWVGWHRRVHDRLRGRADRRPEPRRLGRRRRRRPARRPGLLGRRPLFAALVASRQRPLARP